MSIFTYVSLDLKSIRDKKMSIVIIWINNEPKKDLCHMPTNFTKAAFYFVALVVVC